MAPSGLMEADGPKYALVSNKGPIANEPSSKPIDCKILMLLGNLE
tara:strand:- start:283 stop:417 length:135 start_codon:yes stop_codon:yes gene_type:complete